MMETLFSFFRRLTKNKGLEFNIYKDPNYNAYFYFQSFWSFKGDHAGLCLEISIWKYTIEFEIKDNRHWNYEKDAWQEYDENDWPIP